MDYLLVRNIPADWHSSDLRGFFSEFIESQKLECFHFRHRPEIKTTASVTSVTSTPSTGTAPSSSTDTRCCLIKIPTSHSIGFLARYHQAHWADRQEVDLLTKCLIQRVKVFADSTETPKSEEDSIRKLKETDLKNMLELKPPPLMPQGNVGTPTQFFLKAIQECRLPVRLIAKLKLEFPRARRRRIYGSVPMDYGPTQRRPPVYFNRVHAETQGRTGPLVERMGAAESGSDDDDDACEEWERHEALHNDVAARRIDPTDISQQPGTKERLFEEEMEVTWDKGSSGLVFYTDAQYWKAQEGDFDEQTTDDWDVDMEIYYDETAGDKDARDSVGMRTSTFYRQGRDLPSAFKGQKRQRGGKVESQDDLGGKIGKFEKHTRGFGRRIMEKQGWKDGQGLGSTYIGLTDALGNEGQTDKSGLGYQGESISRFVAPKPKGRERQSIRDVIISTKYDDPDKVDPSEPLMRTRPQNYLSHREKKFPK
ncbi:hypothetical protein TCAL_05207 [Tigriopus californicus]|uniref:G-patch domain-containing protein n=2 Tax=Tigriopus californicus TaxID=6832 RepID=A0A553P0D9_TIGCA|nr:hypothetical protein TCAL_05207 [Tigriopus californicus]|eukprot:TCALIF_05207-PA protein Name:"Similar to Gpatch3 G patch domain-containing protein 3 (Mus musculus)" AED:0.01 eAED:0.01 QI:0/-1/0/1/-1/1/1/0/480